MTTAGLRTVRIKYISDVSCIMSADSLYQLSGFQTLRAGTDFFIRETVIPDPAAEEMPVKKELPELNCSPKVGQQLEGSFLNETYI